MDKDFKVTIHLDDVAYKAKPKSEDNAVPRIKSYFRRDESVKSIKPLTLLECLLNGQTVEPGLCYYSDQNSIPSGGTCEKDFVKQQVFMFDVDNKIEHLPVYMRDNPPAYETPESYREKLLAHNIHPAFFYYSFSHADPNHPHFRGVVIADKCTYSPHEARLINEALSELSNYTDKGCSNLDRIFFGTSKGAVKGLVDPDAVNKLEDLIAFAQEMETVIKERKEKEEQWKLKHSQVDPASYYSNSDSFLSGDNRHLYSNFKKKMRKGESFEIEEHGHGNINGRDDALASFAFGSWICNTLQNSEKVREEVYAFSEHLTPRYSNSYIDKKIRYARNSYIRKVLNDPHYQKDSEEYRQAKKAKENFVYSDVNMDNKNGLQNGSHSPSKLDTHNIPLNTVNSAGVSENGQDSAYMKELKRQAASYNNDYVKDFGELIRKADHIVKTPTGLSQLDEILKGGLYPGLFTLGGVTGCGKTTLALQMADYIAEHGRDVIYFSLEMDRYELMARSISRMCAQQVKGDLTADDTELWMDAETEEEYEQLNRDLKIDADEILTPDRKAQWTEKTWRKVDNVIDTYKKTIGKHLQFICSMGSLDTGQIAELIEHHIASFQEDEKEYDSCHDPVVIVDYLQILAPKYGEERQTDKQKTDSAILDLKRISTKHKIPIIALSSLNRGSYKEPGDLSAFKESGAIEYTSDVLILLQLDGMDYHPFENHRTYRIYKLEELAKKRKCNGEYVWLQFKVLKNRRGTTSDFALDYNARYNLFRIGDYTERQEIKQIAKEANSYRKEKENQSRESNTAINYTEAFRQRHSKY